MRHCPRATSITHAYTLRRHLASRLDRRAYYGRPYSLVLALGAAQMEFRSFDLAILETYRSDPRYEYLTEGVGGYICVANAHLQSPYMPERDRILLETFGFAFNDQHGRAVAVFVRYLARLSPEHQQRWKTHELDGEFRLHPIYFKANVLGEWYEELPILTALLMELAIINKMAEAMGRPKLFNDVPATPHELNGYDFLIRPTQNEFDAFVLLLDKLLSDNLNKSFFGSDISYEEEQERADGKTVIRSKGTLQMLDEWIRLKFRPRDWAVWDASMVTLRKIRRMRQRPAHVIQKDTYDQKFSVEQRQLIVDAYHAVEAIRLALSSHPDVRKSDVTVDSALAEGKICDF
ncbi:MAG: AAA family ATPase [bacterium]|nr:AAA family ATPase [bacterium]